jgi:hypothetical protein
MDNGNAALGDGVAQFVRPSRRTGLYCASALVTMEIGGTRERAKEGNRAYGRP